MSKRLADCQRVIGYHFANPKLLEIALTHSSVRTPDRECNERQEFLGDSVLGLAITEELYKRLPDQQEGELTRIKSAVVSRGALYRVSTRMGLVRFVEVAKGVGRREELPVSLTANLVESIIGAIYLDAGFFPAREFILRNLGPEVEDVMNDRVAKNYKSLLQHEAQQILGSTPIYRTLEEEGPDHRKAFVVAAVIRGTEYGRASGINKKEAEQEAARHALDAITNRGRGRRRRTDGRGDGRGEGRGDERRPEGGRSEGSRYDDRRSDGGRGDAGRSDAGRSDAGRSDVGRDVRPRDRDAVRALGKQTADDDAWRAWAEAPAGTAPPPGVAPTGGAGAPSQPSGPYVVGPEPEEAYHDDAHAGGASSPAAAPRGGRDTRDGRPSRARSPEAGEPPRGPIGAEADDLGATGPGDGGGADAGAPSATDASSAGDPDGPRGRRRRGRRGGRRRRGEGPGGEGPEGGGAASGGDDARPAGDPVPAPAVPPNASDLMSARDVSSGSGPEEASVAPAPEADVERAPRRSAARDRSGDEPRTGRGGRSGGRTGGRKSPAAEEAPRPDPAAEPAARADEPPSEAKAPPRRRSSARDAGSERPAAAPSPAAATSFGHGVAGGETPVPLTRVEREVTPVRGAPAVKKAPAAAPEKPPAGGFGVGL